MAKFKKHQAKRLLTLAKFLERLKPRQFDLEGWVSKAPDEGELGECGTVACACGWAGLMPEFRRQGFRTEKSYHSGDHDDCDEYEIQLTYRNRVSFDAAKAFFGITDEEFERLFMDDSYPATRTRPATVAKRIREVVKTRGVARAKRKAAATA